MSNCARILNMPESAKILCEAFRTCLSMTKAECSRYATIFNMP